MNRSIVITKRLHCKKEKIESIRIYLNNFIFICWAPPYSKIIIDFDYLNWLSLEELKDLNTRIVFVYE